MSYIYKFTSPSGEPQYIGKVSADQFQYLRQRISQHQKDFGEDANLWSIWFVELPSAADADAIETILISRERPPYNTSKTSWGKSSVFPEIHLDWAKYPPNHTPSHGVPNRITMEFSQKVFDYIQIMARMRGQSKKQFAEDVFREHMEKNVDAYALAQELRPKMTQHSNIPAEEGVT